MTEIGSAYISLLASGRGFGKSIQSQVGPQVTKSGSLLGASMGKSLIKGFLAVGVATKVTQFLGDSIAEAREAQKVGAATAAIIKSTGGAAKVSAKQVEALATALSSQTGIDDEQIQTASNLILTFKGIKKAGEGVNDIFGRTTAAALDLSAAGFGSTDSAAKTLGKALNDPVKGLTALTRAGVTFTESQKDSIKAMVESGNLLGAQKAILKEVEGQVGGVAEATSTAGDKAQVAFGNLKEQVGTALLPVLDSLAGTFTDDIAPAVSGFLTDVQDHKKDIIGFGTSVRDTLVPPLSDLVGVTKSAVQFIGGLPGPVKQLGGEVAIAAAVFPKLSGAMTALNFSGLIANLKDTERRTAALGGAARNAAGIAGIGLLIDASRRGDSALGVLEGAAGAAAAGFSLAGPWGALAGGAGGGLVGGLKLLADRTQDASHLFAIGKDDVSDYAASLDEVSGSARQATRDLIAMDLQKTGAFDNARSLGIATADLTKYLLGNQKAIKRVNQALGDVNFTSSVSVSGQNRLHGVVLGQSKAMLELKNVLGVTSDSLAEDQRETRELALASGRLTNALKDVQGHSKIVTRIERFGYPETTKDLAQIIGKMALAREDIKSVIKTLGVPTTVTDLQKVIDRQTNIDREVRINVVTHFSTSGRPTRGGGGADNLVASPKKVGLTTGKLFTGGLVAGIDSQRKAVSNAWGNIANDSAKAFKDKFKALRETVVSNLMPDLFSAAASDAVLDGAGNIITPAKTALQNFLSGLLTTKADLGALTADFGALAAAGIPKGFITQLFAEGGTDLIHQLAQAPDQAAFAATTLKDIDSLTAGLSGAVAANDLGSKNADAKVDKMVKEQKETNRILRTLAPAIADAVAQPAKRARRRAVLAA